MWKLWGTAFEAKVKIGDIPLKFITDLTYYPENRENTCGQDSYRTNLPEDAYQTLYYPTIKEYVTMDDSYNRTQRTYKTIKQCEKVTDLVTIGWESKEHKALARDYV